MTPARRRDDHPHDDVVKRVEAVLDLLRSEGGRVTMGRRAIVTALLTAADHHLTAEDVAKVVQGEHPDVNVSTIYRTLDTLEHHGVIDRINLGPGGAVYHPTDHVHHHLICEVCRTVIELDDDALAPLAADLDRRHQFTLSTHHVSLNGRCHACASAPTSRASGLGP